MEDSTDPNWNRPQNVIKMRKMKVRKRALQGRLCLESESPKKRTKHMGKRFQVQPPPDEEETCEDSTLMDLICMRRPSVQVFVPPISANPWSFSASSNSLSQSSCPLESLPSDLVEPVGSITPEKTSVIVRNHHNAHRNNNNHYHQPEASPSSQQATTPSSSSNGGEQKKRRQLVPTPVLTSHSPASAFIKRPSARAAAAAAAAAAESNHADQLWSEELCQDWSLKSELRIVSLEPFTWGSSKLKLLEETSGTSAFVRCTDQDPPAQGVGACPTSYQLDGSQCVGAQFQHCRLYWQFPHLLDVSVFPRTENKRSNSFSTSQDVIANPGHHYDERVLSKLYMEWVEAFRSVFQLIRARQCPYFYLCTNQFTCLFCAPGLQANDEVQVSITPAPGGFREALKNEGIEFSMPYYAADSSGSEKFDGGQFGSPNMKEEGEENKAESDDEHTQWLNDLGVSQDVSCSTYAKVSPTQINEDRNKAKLVVVSGNKDTLLLFNFLMNSKHLLVAPAGHLAGIPPTIFAPVAFVGACLRNLQTKQNKFMDSKGCAWHSLELQGPILPHTVHMLSGLMLKTIKNFRLHVTTVHGLEYLNFLATREKSAERLRASAFHIQSLSDCGLGKSLLSIFCRYDNVGTVKKKLECVSGHFRWK